MDGEGKSKLARRRERKTAKGNEHGKGKGSFIKTYVTYRSLIITSRFGCLAHGKGKEQGKGEREKGGGNGKGKRKKEQGGEKKKRRKGQGNGASEGKGQ